MAKVYRGAELETELCRLDKLMEFEKKYLAEGYKLIAGVDEVGRGPICGPVVAACVVLPENCRILGINDSKKLSEKRREELFREITDNAVAWSFSAASAEVVDKINILEATKRVMREAVEKLHIVPGFVLVDALTIPGIEMKQLGIIQGDAKSVSIGAASIVAKVIRDRMMREFAKEYPQYLFDKNKGYGTAEHIAAINKHGLCPIHRRSFCRNFAIGGTNDKT